MSNDGFISMPHEQVVDIALSMYADEPCRICRRNIDEADVRGAVFTGYCEVDGRTSRSSHGQCWRDLSDEEKAKMKAEHEAGRGGCRA